MFVNFVNNLYIRIVRCNEILFFFIDFKLKLNDINKYLVKSDKIGKKFLNVVVLFLNFKRMK